MCDFGVSGELIGSKGNADTFIGTSYYMAVGYLVVVLDVLNALMALFSPSESKGSPTPSPPTSGLLALPFSKWPSTVSHSARRVIVLMLGTTLLTFLPILFSTLFRS